MNNNHKPTIKERILTALTNTATPIPRCGDLTEILSSALQAVEPQAAVINNLRLAGNELHAGSFTFRLNPDTRILPVAIGKAAPAMLQGAIHQLGECYTQGLCVSKHLVATSQQNTGTRNIIGNHPVPGAGSLQAGEALRDFVSGLNREDLVLLLVSGGGSALATLPANGITLEEMQQLTTTLLHAGSSIHEINTVRKHVDLIKGGGLIRLASPAKVVALVLSDVVGNNLEVIASGPAFPDPSTYADALKIIKRASRHGVIPDSIRHHLVAGCAGLAPETLKGSEPDALRGFNTIIASNVDAGAAAVTRAREFGYHAETVSNELIGEARTAGSRIAKLVKGKAELPRPFLLIWGGETTVTVSGKGKGGRNQELALGVVRDLAGIPNTLLITLATDGEDGPTDAAGAVVTGDTLNRARDLGLLPEDFLLNNNSYAFFDNLGDLLQIGPTGTNVNDLTFIFGF